MNALERLQDARAATSDGRHEEALAHFLWFHDHALAEDRALAGVRLSFALAHWLALGQKYPPALAAFRARRDAKVAILRAGHLDPALFQDVAAMSEGLGDDEIAAELFAVLQERSPAFGRTCARVAVPLLVRTQRHALARAYMPEPRSHVLDLVEELLQDIHDIEARPRWRAPRFAAFTHNFAENLRDVLTVLSSTGSAALAADLRDEALRLLRYQYIRRAVLKHLAAVTNRS